MANKRQLSNGTWQYTFKRKGVLDKPLYMTFRDEAEGDSTLTGLKRCWPGASSQLSTSPESAY